MSSYSRRPPSSHERRSISEPAACACMRTARRGHRTHQRAGGIELSVLAQYLKGILLRIPCKTLA